MPFTRSIDGITHEYVVNISWTQWVSKEKEHKVEGGWEGGDGSRKSSGRDGGECHQNTAHKILQELIK